MKEEHQFVTFYRLPNKGWAHNLGMSPDWESNLQTFLVDVQDKASNQLSHLARDPIGVYK